MERTGEEDFARSSTTYPSCIMAKAYVPLFRSEGIWTVIDVPDTDVARDLTGVRLLDEPVSRMMSTALIRHCVNCGEADERAWQEMQDLPRHYRSMSV